ncbi:MAG: hypothetical protein KGZ75_09940 [Syntrophomonadaceae bacterium]|jgi:hypothetical protein|nr:hypothetical protein [Syntrophomonadaceae bacterium]
MTHIKIDPNSIPEPFKSMLQGIDLAALEAMLNSMNKEGLTQMFASSIAMVKQKMSPEEFQALEKLFISMINQRNRLE